MGLSQLQYLPLALPHFSLLIGIFLVLVAWIEVQALRVAYMRIGLGPRAALLLLLASLGGSYLNIPVARLAGHQIVSGQEVMFFGMRHVIPVVVEWPDTIVAVNVGGAVIPGLLSLYLLIRYRLWVRGLLAIAGVAVVCHMLAEPVRGLGIALPVFVPPVVSIGGAGTFDGIFLTGILAVLLASIFSPADRARIEAPIPTPRHAGEGVAKAGIHCRGGSRLSSGRRRGA
jgi:uncharacterized membrane protein